MKRFAPDRTVNQPKPVERVEVQENHVKLRVILLIAAVVAAIAAFGVALNGTTSVNSGWRRIEADGASKANCAQDFVFDYCLGGGGVSAAAENKALTLLYTQATEKAYKLFNPRETFEDTVNPCYLNQHINQPVKVEPALYNAFALMEKLNSRYVYLAPVYQEYNNLFFCSEDWETENYDPYQSDFIADYFQQVAAFAQDPAMVNVDLMGDGLVQLTVSPEYLTFAQTYGIDRFIDFYWMTDAFIADFLAELMEENGYTRGAISSYDGFVRTLKDDRLSYSFYVYDQLPQGLISSAARMDYPGGTALVNLHAFPLNAEKEYYYYRFSDGTVRNPYASMADGKSRAALPVLIGTSREMGCAEILLRLLPLYAQEAADETVLRQLPAEGIYPLWCKNLLLTSTDPLVAFNEVRQGYQIEIP